MIPMFLLLALFGAAGALTYSFPVYLKALTEVPPAKFALQRMLFSLFVGGLFAAALTRLVGQVYPWTVQPEPWPLAIGIGFAINPILPIALSKVVGLVENFNLIELLKALFSGGKK